MLEMTVLDIADDDALRYVQRVFESNASVQDRNSARDIIISIRTRIRQQKKDDPKCAGCCWLTK